MVSIYCSYVWRNKPIIVKGSLKRFRNYQYIDDVVNILAESIFNNKLKKNEVFNLTTGKAIRVSKLIKSILKINKKPRYKVIVKKRGTAGDSFGFDASNKYIKKNIKKKIPKQITKNAPQKQKKYPKNAPKNIYKSCIC